MGFKRAGRFVAIALLLIVVAIGAVTYAIPDLRWRGGLVVLKLKGGIPEISLVQLLKWLVPGNPVKLSKMTEGPETRVPWVGEHTVAVLRDELDLDESELAKLRDAGVIA